MSETMTIGRFQLENLLKTGVRFLYFDLRPEGVRAVQTLDLLYGSRAVAPESVLNDLKEKAAPSDAAILLIDEDGSQSPAVAELLEKSGFMNVYVIGGGVAAMVAP